MKTWYLAGSMTGKADYNYPAFDTWAKRLRGAYRDDEIINPAENFGRRQDLGYADYLSLAIMQVARADHIAMLPDWRDSQLGAHLELVVAQALGKRIFQIAEREDAALGWTCIEMPMQVTISHSPMASDPIAAYQVHVHPPEPRPDVEPLEQEAPRIVDEAWDLVMGDRQASYGHPASDFEAMGRISGAILDRWLQSQGLAVVDHDVEQDLVGRSVKPFPAIAPHIVALLMTSVKLSRESAVHKHDNLVDLIGYAICADRIQEGY